MYLTHKIEFILIGYQRRLPERNKRMEMSDCRLDLQYSAVPSTGTRVGMTCIKQNFECYKKFFQIQNQLN